MSPIPYPKMLYHPKTGVGTIVADQAAHQELLTKWAAEAETNLPRRGRPPMIKDVDA